MILLVSRSHSLRLFIEVDMSIFEWHVRESTGLLCP